MTDIELWREAVKAQQNAYAPYSGFKVGAALLDGEGRVFTGCNVENTSLGLTICAERAAVVKAVSEGVRDFARLLVVGGEEKLVPCGACLQVLFEFAPRLVVVLTSGTGAMETVALQDLLPRGFRWLPAGR